METEPLDPAALRCAIADAYEAFRRDTPPSLPLDVCLNCCMRPDLEKEMRQLPLAQLNRVHFYEYNSSAKSEVQPAQELRYLLPRMLQLLADGQEIHHSIELSLDRLGSCPPGTFSETEQQVLNRFALAYFQRAIENECEWGSGPMNVLLMFDIGGQPVAPLLDLWLRSDSPQSTVHFVRQTFWDFWKKQDYENPFADNRPAFRLQLQAWALDPTNRQRFADKLLNADFQQLAASEQPMGPIELGVMVDAVFGHLTQ